MPAAAGRRPDFKKELASFSALESFFSTVGYSGMNHWSGAIISGMAWTARCPAEFFLNAKGECLGVDYHPVEFCDQNVCLQDDFI